MSIAFLRRFSAPLEPEHRARLVEALSTWNFRPHALNEADLFRCACLLFEAVLRVQGLSELGIKQGERCSSSFRQQITHLTGIYLIRPSQPPSIRYSSHLSRTKPIP